MAVNTSDLMMQIANVTAFQQRLAYLLGVQAMIVRAEDAETANHALRDTLARRVLENPQTCATAIVTTFVGRPNMLGGGVTAPDENGRVTSAAEDGSLIAQLATDWNIMAGV